MLDAALLRAGLSREDAYITNLCHYRPYGNKFENCINTSQLRDGIAELRRYIETYKPHCILALGRFPLEHLTGKFGISAWRGSILPCVFDENIKVVATYHPAYVLRNRETYPIYSFDIQRAVAESKTREFDLPEYEMIIDPRGAALHEAVEEIISAEKVAVDIESVKKTNHILCVGFATGSERSFCIPYRESPDYDLAISRILSAPNKKIFHFGNFDTEVLLSNGFPTENYWWDTLTAQHILEPELPRSLAFLTSIYTRMPYYKSSGRSEIPDDEKSWGSRMDKQLLYEYNCRDVIATFRVQAEQEKEIAELDAQQQALFRFEMEEIPMAGEIGRTGVLIDPEKRNLFNKAILYRWGQLQNILEVVVGHEVNVKGPKFKDVLYTELGLPPRYKRDAKGQQKLTADEDAIVSLIAYVQDSMATLVRESAIAGWKRKLLVLKTALAIREIRQLRSNYLKNPISADNRARSTYKVSNVDTGRWACEKYIDKTGLNAQTFARGGIDIPDEISVLDSVDVRGLDESGDDDGEEQREAA